MIKLSLKAQLRLAFVLVLLIVIIISSSALISASKTASSFSAYQNQTANATIVSQLQEGLLMARIQAIKYFSDQSNSYVKNFNEWAKLVDKYLNVANREFVDAQNKQNVRLLESKFSEYKDAFANLTKL